MTVTYTEARALVRTVLRAFPPDPDFEAAAWAGLHHALERTDGSGSFVAYAQMCMRGAVRNAWRAKRVVPSTGWSEDVAESASAEPPPPRDPALHRQLQRALRRLTPRQAEAVELVLAEGLGYKAAGERMGVKATSVQHLVYWARFDLRAALQSVHHEANQ